MKELFDELYRRLHEDIKYAVSPKSLEFSVDVKDVVELAVEIWRMEQRLIKAAELLPENQKIGIDNSLQKLKRFIAKYDIETIDYTGQKFNDGLNFDVLSFEQNPEILVACIKETVEPTVMCKGQVIRKAKVVVVKN